MVLPIYIYGHPVLRAENATVTPDFPNLQELIENMKETMYHTQGIGIAAPQVGVNARIVYIDVDVLAEDFPELKDVRMVLINPEITVDETTEGRVASTSLRMTRYLMCDAKCQFERQHLLEEQAGVIVDKDTENVPVYNLGPVDLDEEDSADTSKTE